MNELSKKEKNKTIGEVTKALNEDKRSILIITDKMTTAKGNIVEIMAFIAKFLKTLREDDLIGKLAVDSLVSFLINLQKKDKKIEDMDEDELLEELGKSLKALKNILDQEGE